MHPKRKRKLVEMAKEFQQRIPTGYAQVGLPHPTPANLSHITLSPPSLSQPNRVPGGYSVDKNIFDGIFDQAMDWTHTLSPGAKPGSS